MKVSVFIIKEKEGEEGLGRVWEDRGMEGKGRRGKGGGGGLCLSSNIILRTMVT